jgi:hypothetical protein
MKILDQITDRIKLEEKYNPTYNPNDYIIFIKHEALLQLIKEVDGMIYYSYKNNRFMNIEVQEKNIDSIILIKKELIQCL